MVFAGSALILRRRLFECVLPYALFPMKDSVTSFFSLRRSRWGRRRLVSWPPWSSSTCGQRSTRSGLWCRLYYLTYQQRFGSGSGLKSDSIRSVDPDPRGQNWPTKIEKAENFMFWSAGCSLLRADILVRIRIFGSVPLTNESWFGSRSCYFRQWPSKCFLPITFWSYIYIIFQG